MKKTNFRRVLCLLMALCMVICLLPMSRASAVAADDSSFDIPLAELSVSCGDYEPNGGASEGPRRQRPALPAPPDRQLQRYHHPLRDQGLR